MNVIKVPGPKPWECFIFNTSDCVEKLFTLIEKFPDEITKIKKRLKELEKENDEIEIETWDGWSFENDFDKLTNYIAYLIKVHKDKVILHSDVNAVKSAVSINLKTPNKIIIICPENTFDTWESKINEFTGRKDFLRIDSSTNIHKPIIDKFYKHKKSILLISHNVFKNIDLSEHINKPFDYFIIDECGVIRSKIEAIRRFYIVRSKATNALALSGDVTIENKLLILFDALAIVYSYIVNQYELVDYFYESHLVSHEITWDKEWMWMQPEELRRFFNGDWFEFKEKTAIIVNNDFFFHHKFLEGKKL